VGTFTLHESNLEKFASDLAQEWDPQIREKGIVVSFSGKMGAGKTTLIRALCSYWNLEKEVCSPSYVLQNIYINSMIQIDHWDICRLDELPMELTEEVIPGILRLIEWGELFELEKNILTPKYSGLLQICKTAITYH